MGRSRLTILIAARNAEKTIGRAVKSCLMESCEILLIDDHSHDDTVSIAMDVSRGHLRVISVPDPGGVARARQCGLDHLDTEFAAWLDADDEWLAGRGERLASVLSAGYDVATEAMDLHNSDGGFLRRLSMPDYLLKPNASIRLFERNGLPGDTQVAFRSRVFQDLGYRAEMEGAESFDILLRGIWNGQRHHYGTDVGYRMYAYPDSVSRDLERQRRCLADALEAFDYSGVHQRYLDSGYSERVSYWGLVSMALFRRDADAALVFAEMASPSDVDPDEILEPDGPWPVPEGWRRAFTLGTARLLKLDDPALARELLCQAEKLFPAAESANNLGVAWRRLGEPSRAEECFTLALARFPGYFDARRNLESHTSEHLTTHPLRRQASRSEY